MVNAGLLLLQSWSCSLRTACEAQQQRYSSLEVRLACRQVQAFIPATKGTSSCLSAAKCLPTARHKACSLDAVCRCCCRFLSRASPLGGRTSHKFLAPQLAGRTLPSLGWKSAAISRSRAATNAADGLQESAAFHVIHEAKLANVSRHGTTWQDYMMLGSLQLLLD